MFKAKWIKATTTRKDRKKEEEKKRRFKPSRKQRRRQCHFCHNYINKNRITYWRQIKSSEHSERSSKHKYAFNLQFALHGVWSWSGRQTTPLNYGGTERDHWLSNPRSARSGVITTWKIYYSCVPNRLCTRQEISPELKLCADSTEDFGMKVSVSMYGHFFFFFF